MPPKKATREGILKFLDKSPATPKPSAAPPPDDAPPRAAPPRTDATLDSKAVPPPGAAVGEVGTEPPTADSKAVGNLSDTVSAAPAAFSPESNYAYAVYVNNIYLFGKYHKWKFTTVQPNQDSIVTQISMFSRLRFEAVSETPRGARHRVVVLLIAQGGGAASSGPALRDLLDRQVAGDLAELDELVLVVPEDFSSKSKLMNVVATFRNQINAAGAARHDAARSDVHNVRVGVLRYSLFAMEIPQHVSVPRLQILDSAEAKRRMDEQRLRPADLPSTMSESDPLCIWHGARAGQYIEVVSDSETAGSRVELYCVREAPFCV